MKCFFVQYELGSPYDPASLVEDDYKYIIPARTKAEANYIANLYDGLAIDAIESRIGPVATIREASDEERSALDSIHCYADYLKSEYPRKWKQYQEKYGGPLTLND